MNALDLKEETIRVTDDVTGYVWEIPKRHTTELVADVHERWVANVIVPERVACSLVQAPFLEPEKSNGHYVVSLCMIFMRHAAPAWAPLNMGPASRNCALRVACIDVRDNSPAVWVDHRYSDSQLVEALSKLGFPPVHARLKVSIHDHGMEIRTTDGIVDLRMVEHAIQVNRPKAFASLENFEHYFTKGVRSYGPGINANEATIIDMYKDADNAFEHMRYYHGYLKTSLGAWPVDSVYRTLNGRYRWIYQGNAHF